MSDTIIPTMATTAPRRQGLVDGWLRSAVMRRLSHLEHGRIVLRDGQGTVTFGRENTPGLSAVAVVDDTRFYREVAMRGSLGVAEAWIRGWWRCDDLATLLRIFLRNMDAADRVESGLARLTSPVSRLWHTLRGNTVRGSRRNIQAHYDLGNDFFSAFLDETMTYSCGIFERPEATMLEASIAKIDRICRKLNLAPDDHVVEIGTGWGSFALHAASRYGCRVTTTTVSKAQHRLATQRIEDAGLSDRVTVLLKDYRHLEGSFDKLVSIEMIEAVGHEFLPAFFRTCAQLLKKDGQMLIQAITMPDQRYAQYRRSVDFIRRYVFPGSCVPSIQAMVDAAVKSSDLRLVHLEDITPHYGETMRRWRARFLQSAGDIRKLGYPESLIRMWVFYLGYCEAGFDERYIGDVHVLLNRPECRAMPILPPLPAQTSLACPEDEAIAS